MKKILTLLHTYTHTRKSFESWALEDFFVVPDLRITNVSFNISRGTRSGFAWSKKIIEQKGLFFFPTPSINRRRYLHPK